MSAPWRIGVYILADFVDLAPQVAPLVRRHAAGALIAAILTLLCSARIVPNFPSIPRIATIEGARIGLALYYCALIVSTPFLTLLDPAVAAPARIFLTPPLIGLVLGRSDGAGNSGAEQDATKSQRGIDAK